MEFAIESSIPLAAGVSSSAALLVATALCMTKLYDCALEKMSLAKLCHAAEHDFVGANNGLLDHFCSVFGKKNHVLYLDCRNFDYDISPISSKNLVLGLCQTNVRHSIVEGEYQARRKQCKDATDFFAEKRNSVRALRDVSAVDLAQWGKEMEPVLLKRASHIVGENDRVSKGKALLKDGKLAEFGKLLYESHESSRNNFENSCPELDCMVDIAKSAKGVWGSRLTGGGFGGCALVFIAAGSEESFKTAVETEYPKKTNKKPEVFFCKVSDGAKILEN
jgi:galactokinase